MDTTHKNTVIDYFFHKLIKRITSENGTAGNIGPRVAKLSVALRYTFNWLYLTGMRH